MLDTADRFVNCKSAKYYLRNSEVDIAVETAALFTRVRSIYIVYACTHTLQLPQAVLSCHLNP